MNLKRINISKMKKFTELYQSIINSQENEINEGWKEWLIAGTLFISGFTSIANSTHAKPEQSTITQQKINQNNSNEIRKQLEKINIKLNDETSLFEAAVNLTIQKDKINDFMKDVISLTPNQISFLENFKLFNNSASKYDETSIKKIGGYIIQSVLLFKANNILVKHNAALKRNANDIINNILIKVDGGKILVKYAGSISPEFNITPYLSKDEFETYIDFLKLSTYKK